MKYIPPQISEKKCQISFFLTYNSFVDSMEYMFGAVVDAQSGDSGCNNSCQSSPGEDSNDSPGSNTTESSSDSTSSDPGSSDSGGSDTSSDGGDSFGAPFIGR